MYTIAGLPRALRVIAVVFAVAHAVPAARAQLAPVHLDFCGCDVNNTGTLTVQDIFDDLALYFGNDLRADMNGNGVLSVQDIFDMLACYFAGCPTYAGNPNPHDTGYAIIGMPGCPSTMTAMSAATAGLASGVHLFSGEFFRHEVDLRIPGRGFDFVWARTYRSQQGQFFNAMGHRWDFSYNIYVRAPGVGSADLILHDGALARQDLYSAQTATSWRNDEFFRSIVRNPDMSHTVYLPDGARWSLNALDGSPVAGKINAITDRNGNSMTFSYSPGGNLIRVTDTLNRFIDVDWLDPNFIHAVRDYTGRSVTYAYYNGMEPGGAHADLKSVTSPAVTGTPTANDFPSGKTTTYTYTAGNPRPDLNHLLLSITDPRGQTFLRNEYNTAAPITDPQFGRLTRQTWGNIGDVIDLVNVSQTPAPANNFATRKVIVNDRMGNVKECFYNAPPLNRGVLFRELTGRADPDQPTTETTNRPVNKVRASDPNQFEIRWSYTSSGLPARIDYPNGTSILNTYDAGNVNWLSRGNLLQRQRLPGPLGGDQASITESWTYLADFGGCACGGVPEFVLTHADPRGNVTSYSYDSRGNRTQTIHRVASAVENWEYNQFGQMTAHIHANNGSGHRRRDEYSYYTSGPQMGYRRTKTVDATGEALTNTYECNARGAETRVIDPQGRDLILSVNQLDQVVRVTSRETAAGIRRSRDRYFDAADNLSRVDVENRDENGVLGTNTHFTRRWEYDILNMQTREIEEIDQGIDVTTETVYDGNRLPIFERDGEAVAGGQTGTEVLTLYDERNLPFRQTRAPGDPGQSTCEWSYDGNGNMTMFREGIEDGGGHATTKSYDGFDRFVSGTDPTGNVFTAHWTPGNEVASIRLDGELTDVAGSAQNVRLREVLYTYDNLDRLIRADTAHFDTCTQAPIGDGMASTTVTYAPTGALLTLTDDNGRVRTYTYDTVNRRRQTTDPAGNTVLHEYDMGGNLTRLTRTDVSSLGNPAQTLVTTMTYDSDDRRITTADNLGNTTTTLYNSRDLPVVRIDPRGNRTQRTYDGLERLTQLSRQLTSTGDGNGAVIGSVVTTYAYDASSRLIAQTDADARTTRHAYDKLGRRIVTRLADGTLQQVGQGASWPSGNSPNLGSFVSGYDVHDNAVVVRASSGSILISQFDEAERLIRRDIVPGPGVDDDTTLEIFRYDARNMLVSAQDDDSLLTRCYDSQSALLSESLNGQSTSYLRDGVGNPLTVTYPGGQAVTSTFDALNRKFQISSTDQVARLDYIGHRPERTRYPHSQATEAVNIGYQYDGAGRFTGMTSVRDPSGQGVVLDNRQYTWDAASNRTQRSGLLAAAGGWQHSYQYDSLNRLASTVRTRPGNPIENFTYQLSGSQERQSVGGPVDPGAYTGNLLHQYLQTPFDTRGYDLNGNLSQSVGQSSTATFTYDAHNRLVRHVNSASGITSTYSYDAIGRRIAKTVGAQATRYYYDGPSVIEERNGAGATIATHIYGHGIDHLLQSRRGMNETYFHAEPMGTVTMTSDRFGVLIQRFEYEDFGRPVFFGVPPAVTPALFTGRWYDQESGLYHYRARSYDPRAGQFISRDPVGLWEDPVNLGNPATYVGNNPWSRTDPFGLLTCEGEYLDTDFQQCGSGTIDYLEEDVICHDTDGPSNGGAWDAAEDVHWDANDAVRYDDFYDRLIYWFSNGEGSSSISTSEMDDIHDVFHEIHYDTKDKEIRIECGGAYCGGDVNAYVYTNNRVHLCDGFWDDWDDDSQRRAAILYHEWSHCYAGTNDEGYLTVGSVSYSDLHDVGDSTPWGSVPDYDKNGNDKDLSQSQLRKNADSYENFLYHEMDPGTDYLP